VQKTGALVAMRARFSGSLSLRFDSDAVAAFVVFG
jgi:hypothetical protein